VGVAALAAALAVGGTAGTVAAAHQGAFGQEVKAKVDACKDALKAGTHGIGDCVSDFATTNGKSDQTHGQNDQTHGNAPSTPGKPSNPGNSGAHGRPTVVPGKPTGTPGRP
jgi:hypothetical protein